MRTCNEPHKRYNVLVSTSYNSMVTGTICKNMDWKITRKTYWYLYITCLLTDCMPKIDPSITGAYIGLATINYLMFS